MGELHRRRSSGAAKAKQSAIKPSRDAERFANRQRRFCQSAVTEMMKDENSVNFSRPVLEMWDATELVGYTDKIKEPMDLGTVLKRVEDKNYYLFDEVPLFSPDAFSRELRLTFENAMLYNDKETDMYSISKKFLRWFNSYMQNLPTEYKSASGGTSKSFSAPNALVALQTLQKNNATPADAPTPAADADRENQQHSSDGEADAAAEETSHSAETQRILADIASLREDRVGLEERLATADLQRNAPLTEKERVRLRDEVENLPWERCKGVVEILRAAVDEALARSDEKSPDFVDIDLDTIAPHKLREVADFLNPPPGDGDVAETRAKLEKLDAQIEDLTARLPKDAETRHKKRPRESRERDKRRKRR